MTQDHRARTRERALQARPEDPGAWLEVMRARQRAGEQAEAQEAALEALRRAPQDGAVLEALLDLGWSGPWTAEDGDASGASRSPLDGPREGIVAWRIELPQPLTGRPLVDARGRVVVRGATSGLYRVDPAGRDVEPLGEWPIDVPPLLVGEAAGAFDPSAHLFRGPGAAAPRVGRSIRSATGEAWVAARDALIALDPEGGPRWRAANGEPSVLAAGTRGPVWAWFAAARGEVDGTLLAWARDTGKVLGAHKLPGPLSFLAEPGGAAWAASRGELVSLSSEAKVVRRFPLAGPGALALGPAHLLLATRRDGLLGLDPATGEQRWRRPDLRAILPPAVDASGEAVLVTLEGRVAAVGPGGARSFELDVDRRGALGAPSLGPGRAYVTSGRWLLAIR